MDLMDEEYGEMEDGIWFESNDVDRRPSPENIVVVSLPEKYEEGKSTLDWALKYFSGNDSICFAVVHVCAPIRTIPLMGVEIEAIHVGSEVVEGYRKLEKERLNGILNKYLYRCQQTLKFKAFKVLVEAEDVYEGLLDIVRTHDISKIVTGTMQESRTAPSEGAKKLMKEAKSSCKIWFVSNGKLIFTRISVNTGDASSSSNGRNEEAEENGEEKEGEMELDTDPLEKFKKKAYEASSRREIAEKEMFWVWQKSMLLMAKMSSELHSRDVQWREDVDEFLEKEEKNIEQLRLENQRLKNQLAQVQGIIDQKEEMETRLSEAQLSVRDIQGIAAAARDRNESLESEKIQLEKKLNDAKKIIEELTKKASEQEESSKQLLLERNVAMRENEELRDPRNRGDVNFCSGSPIVTEFSLEEINKATHNFSSSRKIGEGGFGPVFKGFLRNTTVAIKKLDPKSLQSRTEYEQEINILSKVRHPNIVTLMGSCREESTLVYEYLSNGSLEDRLGCKGNTPPLTWQQRTRIIGEVCSALIFLHSAKPHPIVHGDLKPANILLDANLVSKLGDFGIARVLRLSTHITTPKGEGWYMDPEFGITGEITPKSDVYSLGITILRLLTGRLANKISQIVKATSSEELKAMIDPSAGEWPFAQARILAYVGVQCSEIERINRPDLLENIWPQVKSLFGAVSLHASPCCRSIPDYFICPIVQEIMKDPHVAADGFTYEFTAIRQWFGAHSTSPMTNVQLRNCDLLPNYSLGSAIKEWTAKHPEP